MRTKAKRIRELEAQVENARFIIETLEKRNAILRRRYEHLKEEYERLKAGRSEG